MKRKADAAHDHLPLSLCRERIESDFFQNTVRFAFPEARFFGETIAQAVLAAVEGLAARCAQPKAAPAANADPNAVPNAVPNTDPNAVPNAVPNTDPNAVPNADPITRRAQLAPASAARLCFGASGTISCACVRPAAEKVNHAPGEPQFEEMENDFFASYEPEQPLTAKELSALKPIRSHPRRTHRTHRTHRTRRTRRTGRPHKRSPQKTDYQTPRRPRANTAPSLDADAGARRIALFSGFPRALAATASVWPPLIAILAHRA